MHRAVPALSFEFTTILRDVAKRALARCAALGPYRFNAEIGESQHFVFAEWTTAWAVESWLNALPDEANSGDIYAALDPPNVDPANGAISPDRLPC